MSRSKTTNGDDTSTPHEHAFSFCGYIREEGRAAIFVAACVTILHLWFHWLDAIESYAFLVLGNLSSAVTDKPTPNPDAVVVVRIDEPTFVTRYRERSPLDRCTLSSQLSAIYAAKPHTVVIDLDLSPSDWAQRETGPAAERERYCQALLEATLAQSVGETCPRQDQRGIRTAIMEPFHSSDPEVAARVAKWRDKQECAGIRFGDAALPVTYGMTLDYFTGDHTLYAAATRDTVVRRVAGDAADRSNERRKIDTRAYTRNLQPVFTSWTNTPVEGTADYTDADLTATLEKLLPKAAQDGRRNRIVFFGAGYGKEDTFLTPFGTLYGVEVHAAAFTSPPLLRQSHALEVFVDLVFAIIFGMLIVYCWDRYFAWRCNDGTWHAQLAWLWVAGLLLGLLIMIAIASIVSFLLLRHFGLWLSPIAVALGMLIESCMAGSVEAAVRRMLRIQPVEQPVPAAQPAIKWATDFNKAVWGAVVVAAVLLVVFH